MERFLMERLLQWKDRPDRKPLILEGARQVGKTWLAREFGRRAFENTAYVNFWENDRAKELFSQSLGIPELIYALSLYSGESIRPQTTLIVLDEIQEAPRVLGMLKRFCEEAPEYAVLATGSSTGVTLHRGTGWPVGKVDHLQLYPMTFGEFLLAGGDESLREICRSGDARLMDAFHEQLLNRLARYMVIGGMPEAVDHYASSLPSAEPYVIREIQRNILDDYQSDFSKHLDAMPQGLTVRLNQVWESIPGQLSKINKRYVYRALASGARARDFELAIQWLVDSSLVLKVNEVNPPEYPLAVAQNFEAFKLFLLDVGLLCAMAEIDVTMQLEWEKLFPVAKGALAEQFICQELVAYGYQPYYWEDESHHAELDFLIQHGSDVVPIEVKSGENLRSKSLATALKRFGYSRAIRFSAAKPSWDGAILDLPLYAVESVGKFLRMDE